MPSRAVIVVDKSDVELARVTRIARMLDGGLDPILGLVPGVGDLIGSMLGLYVVGLAVRRKVAPIIIARMLMNLAIDAGLGAIPFLGDAFDFVFKANNKNVALLSDRSVHGGKASARDWVAVIGAATLFVGVLVLAIWGFVSLIKAIVR